MKRLIVNADDLGADEGRNRGIFEAIEAGAVTSVSILANGPGLDHALETVAGLRGVNISPGVHVNLSEGKPISAGLRRLSGADGAFRGKAAAHELLMQSDDEELAREVVREIGAQIRLLRDAGVPVRHLDGHQHVHVFPAVIRSAVEAAVSHAIPWIRIPDEPCPVEESETVSRQMAEETRLFLDVAQRARGHLQGGALRAPDRFFGLYWKGRLTTRALEAMVKNLPEGVTELMVHPGRVMGEGGSGPFHSFSTADREQELETLKETAFQEILEKYGVILIPFPGNES